MELLRSLAEETGGSAYVAGSSGRLDPDPLITDLENLQREELGKEKRVVREERYQWPLGLALLCLMVEMVLHDRRRPSRRRRRQELQTAEGGAS